MSDTVIIEQTGAAGIIRLNRPQALNALKLEMVQAIAEALESFAADPLVRLVLIEGEGERAFCAGGDIRAIAQSGRAGDGEAQRFWREEYRLNAAIARYDKPVAVRMDGIVMGGGAGLSIHARHRIVTDRTRFAMPEVGIGFIPDVGATFRLPRAPGGLGRYLALSGDIVGAADVIAAGLADRMVPAHGLGALRAALLGEDDAEALDETIASLCAEPEPGIQARHGEAIETAFVGGEIEDVLERLARDGGTFAAKTRATILSRSPSSLRETDSLLTLGERTATLEECLDREFVAACRTLERLDYYEGVRAAVIDKDRNPRWQPATLAEVGAIAPGHFDAPAGLRLPFRDREGTR